MAEEQVEVQEKQPKKSSAVKYVIVGMIVMILIPVIGFFVASKYIFTQDEEDTDANSKQQVGIIYPLKVVVVNIANTGATRYLRAGISFELQDKLAIKELTEREPQITDLVIMVLSVKELEDLVDFSGKNQIRKEIIEKVNTIMVTGKIKNAYFTEFVIQ
ncbi:MAG: flagellar basal body-associated FliL family protein [Candidatus Auribacterota bacterium]|jgi:flagellar FliL protein|nr:flagellar basal body-associated FliL family protein [Candidatus Auribacterota bacterium]